MIISYWKHILLIITIVCCTSCSDTASETLLLTKKGVTASVISQDGRLAAIASAYHDMSLWNLQQKKRLYTLRHSPDSKANIITMAFNGNGNRLLSADKRHLVLWNTRTGKAIDHYQVNSDIQAIALSQDGKFALIGMLNAESLLFDLDSNYLRLALQQTQTVNAVAISYDNKYALTGGDDHLAILWDLNKGRAIFKLKHNKNVMQLAFSPDGSKIITACNYEYIRIYDRKTGKLLHRLDTPRVSITSLRFSNDSQYLALGVMPQQLELWHLGKKPRQIERWYLPKPSIWRPAATLIYGIAFSKDNILITTDTRGIASFWQTMITN